MKKIHVIISLIVIVLIISIVYFFVTNQVCYKVSQKNLTNAEKWTIMEKDLEVGGPIVDKHGYRRNTGIRWQSTIQGIISSEFNYKNKISHYNVSVSMGGDGTLAMTIHFAEDLAPIRISNNDEYTDMGEKIISKEDADYFISIWNKELNSMFDEYKVAVCGK